MIFKFIILKLGNNTDILLILIKRILETKQRGDAITKWIR